jgi:hypothetical protein
MLMRQSRRKAAEIAHPSKFHTRHDSRNDVTFQFGEVVALAMSPPLTNGDHQFWKIDALKN